MGIPCIILQGSPDGRNSLTPRESTQPGGAAGGTMDRAMGGATGSQVRLCHEMAGCRNENDDEFDIPTAYQFLNVAVSQMHRLPTHLSIDFSLS